MRTWKSMAGGRLERHVLQTGGRVSCNCTTLKFCISHNCDDNERSPDREVGARHKDRQVRTRQIDHIGSWTCLPTDTGLKSGYRGRDRRPKCGSVSGQQTAGHILTATEISRIGSRFKELEGSAMVDCQVARDIWTASFW